MFNKKKKQVFTSNPIKQNRGKEIFLTNNENICIYYQAAFNDAIMTLTEILI